MMRPVTHALLQDEMVTLVDFQIDIGTFLVLVGVAALAFGAGGAVLLGRIGTNDPRS